MLTADRLARQIKAKRSGRGYMARCPAHDDRTASLSFQDRIDGKGLLMNCFANCSYPSIVEAFQRQGIEIPQLNGRDRAQSIEATYDYTDENGDLLFQVVRKRGKQFQQRRPLAVGDWAWQLGDVRRVLYRLPELIEAVANEHPVLICEGEKDVDNLRKLNVVATTSPGGAGKWRPEYCEQLKGADVVICPDNDGPGRDHADEVAAALQGIAKRVRWLVLPDLPVKGD